MTQTTEQRSRIMRAVKSQNTKPEMLVRRLVHSMGFRYRLHCRDLPGAPDLVFSGLRRVVFVNGCFWHGHRCCRGARVPMRNREYWVGKVAKNIARDQCVRRELRRLGWKSITIWECQLKNTSRLKQRVVRFLKDTK